MTLRIPMTLLASLTRENKLLRAAVQKIAYQPRFVARLTARRVLIKVDRLHTKSKKL